MLIVLSSGSLVHGVEARSSEKRSQWLVVIRLYVSND